MTPKNEGAIKPAGERQVKISRWISGKSAESLQGLPELRYSFGMTALTFLSLDCHGYFAASV
jgi:hypothetical protein